MLIVFNTTDLIFIFLLPKYSIQTNFLGSQGPSNMTWITPFLKGCQIQHNCQILVMFTGLKMTNINTKKSDANT